MKPRHAAAAVAACLLAACGGRGEPAPATQAVAVEARAESPAETPLPAGWPGFDTLRADSRDRLFDDCMGRASVISMQQYVGASEDYQAAIAACHRERALRDFAPAHAAATDRPGIEPPYSRMKAGR